MTDVSVWEIVFRAAATALLLVGAATATFLLIREGRRDVSSSEEHTADE